MIKYIYLILLSFLFASCEDVIDLDLDPGESQLVVDALLTNDSLVQTIRLTQSAAYFSNVPTPFASGAKVSIIGPGNVEYPFNDQGNGNYNYDPSTLGRLDSTGFDYKLQLEFEGKSYIANSKLNPVPPIDSMTYSFEESDLGQEEGYYTQFWAKDFFGRKDYYYIKAFKNGLPIDENVSALILSEDAAFGGNGADGFVFILPIRAAITNDDEPFEINDTSSVELLSMNRDAYEFLQQATVQANNGGLFSTPPANIKSNIKDASGNSQNEVLGVFSLSSISRNSIIVKE